MVLRKTINFLCVLSLPCAGGFRGYFTTQKSDLNSKEPSIFPVVPPFPESSVAGKAIVEFGTLVNTPAEQTCQHPHYIWESIGVSLGVGGNGRVIAVRNIKHKSCSAYVGDKLKRAMSVLGKVDFAFQKAFSEGSYVAATKEQRKDSSPKNAFLDRLRSWWTRLKSSFRNKKRVFALKFALSQGGNASIQREIDVMRSATQNNCGHVMSLVDENPCFKYKRDPHPKQLVFAYVSPKMAGDLQAWLTVNRGKETIKQCATTIAEQTKEGLLCLHGSGYVHNDFKPDNVFFEGIDRSGCPAGLRLADFGVSEPLDSMALALDSNYLGRSFHIADSLFYGPTNLLGLKSADYQYYLVKPIVDWCSYSLVMHEVLGVQLRDLFGNSTLVYCGRMGIGRQKLVYAPQSQ